MPERLCVRCGKVIYGLRWKYCSEECYQATNHAKYSTLNPFKGKTYATTGAISELRVAVDLLAKGYDVFRALSPNCPCDLAILKDGKLLRIEVRTAHISTSGKLYKTKNKRDDPNNIDHYAWVLPDKVIYEPDLELL